MKRILGEYSQIIGYTVTGLIFGLSFFLLFINFYHFKEVNIVVEKQDYTDQLYEKIQNNTIQTRTNAAFFNVNLYNGTENRYELLSIQSRLNVCADVMENQEVKELFQKDNITIKDVYNLESLYQRKIVNDCIVRQLYDLTVVEGEDAKFTSNNIKTISPFIKLQADALIKRTNYIASNIENNSSYFFNNEDARDQIFNETKDSYYQVLAAYDEASQFLLEISKWYANIVGGVA